MFRQAKITRDGYAPQPRPCAARSGRRWACNAATKLRDRMRIHLRTRHCSIRTVHELPGHADVSTTMIYTHVLNKGGRGIWSPA